MSAQIKLLRSVVLGVVAASLLAITACLDDSPVAPAATPAQLQFRVLLGNGSIPEDDWTVAIRVFYVRRNESEIDLPATPSTIQVERGTSVTRSVQVNIAPCLDDPQRVRDEGDEAGCELHVNVQLLDGDVVLSEETHEALVSDGSEVVEVEPFTLPAGELSYDGSAAVFSAAQGGPIPDARSYTITGTTSQSFGTLSTEITYGNGTGWLTATVNQSEGSSVTIRPANTELAPGVYNAWVEVNSNRGFVPAEIPVQYTVTERAKTLTIGGAGLGSGSVSSNPAGAACTSTAGALSGTCSLAFTHGATVTLAATPAFGSLFAGWTGACTGTTCSLAMTSDRAVTANFTLVARQLTVTAAGTGNGTVTSVPSVVTCTATAGVATGLCVAQLNHGTQVTLTATPATGSTFTGWSGGTCSGPGPCTMTMDQARTATASFNVTLRQLTVGTNGSGGGTVTSNIGAINCLRANQTTSGTCVVNYNFGTQVTLNAAPNINSTFTGWSGSCSGTGACVVTMDQAHGVTATFTNAVQRLSVLGAGTGSGVVSSIPGGISCSIAGGQLTGVCAADFLQGSTVTLTANPTGGGTFTSWSGSCTASGNTCAVLIDQPKVITASFAGPPPPGRDLVVVNDINVLDATAMADPNNVQFARNLLLFSSAGPRNAGRVLQIDCDRGGRTAYCATINPFQTLARDVGFTPRVTTSSPSQPIALASDVKVLVLLLSCSSFTTSELNTLKLFAAEGGRIIFLGENTDAFPLDCIAIENQLLADMGAQMTNVGDRINCGYIALPESSLRAHQITTSLKGLTVACTSQMTLGPNDFALFYDTSNSKVLGAVARIDVTPIPGGAEKPPVVSNRPLTLRPVLSDPRLTTGHIVPPTP